MSSSDPSRQWDEVVASFPDPHVLQTGEWGQAKQPNGWQPFYLIWHDAQMPAQVFRHPPEFSRIPTEPAAAALALWRGIPMRGFTARLGIVYTPKGPLVRDWADAALRQRVLTDLARFGRKQGAILVKIDPDVRLGVGVPRDAGSSEDPLGIQVSADLSQRGWCFSSEQVQFRNTVLLHLDETEENLLGRMKQKTRYNIRLAERKGVQVRIGNIDDLPLLYRMYAETSVRDSFVIRDEGYYRQLWGAFMANAPAPEAAGAAPLAEALLAEVQGEAVAALIVFIFAGRAWYMFGMSRQAHREKMPNHLLQWEAMRRLRALGVSEYDLWGAPDDFTEQDALWGVYRFKEGLGGQVVRHLGAWDLPVQPLYYQIYTRILPRFLGILRRRGKRRTRRDVQS